MTSSILWAGGEDIDFLAVGTLASANIGSNNVMCLGIDTTAGRFRSGYARYGLFVSSFVGQSGNTGIDNLNAQYWATPNTAFSASTFWFSGRVYNSHNLSGNADGNSHVLRFIDSGGVVRLRLRCSTSASVISTMVVEKVNAAGSATSLGTTTSGLSLGPGTPDKIDAQVIYAVSGTLNIWINGVPIFSYAGDITTDSQTLLSGFQLMTPAQYHYSGASTNGGSTWSECLIATRDTRNMSLATQAASATGNTDTFTAGAAANINGNTYKDNSPDYAASAGLIQQYTVTPAMPSGNFGVISLVQKGRVSQGSSGPTKIDFMVRNGGTDYTSSDLTPTAAFSTLVYNWDTNPNTSAAWATSDLAASSSAFNLGYKSVA